MSKKTEKKESEFIPEGKASITVIGFRADTPKTLKFQSLLKLRGVTQKDFFNEMIDAYLKDNYFYMDTKLKNNGL